MLNPKRTFQMITTLMKWVSIIMLLLAVLQFPAAGGQLLLAIVVCVSCVLLVRQAVRAGRYSWAIIFVVIAALFNPVVLVARSASSALWVNALGLLAFLIAAVALRPGRRLTVLSITNRSPRRESL
jgi:hypothetical protein